MVLCFSCNEEDSTLKFEKDYYEVQLLDQPQYIEFNTTSNDLDVIVENRELLNVEIDGNKLKLYAKSKGETTITVKNNYDKAQIIVRIVDSYLSFHIGEPVNIDGKFIKYDRLFLINNSNRDFYVLNDSFEIKIYGTYLFNWKNEKLYLSLMYDSREDVYDISGSSHELKYNIFPIYLNLTRAATPITMRAVDITSGVINYFILDKCEFPYNMLR